MDFHPGEVHVLAGENGAGKSTLIGILAGIHSDYAGHMAVDGKAEMREVTTGITDDTHIEIREGLTGGETVITGPFRLLRTELAEGDAVQTDD